MELFSPIALTYLIPRYHEKYADCILMFFRMNNIGVFEACREAREQFMNLIGTQEFKQTFQREFFSEDGTMFDLEKYNTFALLVMIKMCHRIFSRFVFGETVLIGGKKQVATRRHKKTRKLYGGSPVQEISQNLQLQEKNLAIQTFLSQVPYNGILGIDEFDDVSAFILQQVFPTSFQDYFKQNEGSFYCVSLVTLYVQHLVPAMIPFDTIREFLFQNPQENQVGGQKTKKRFFVPQWKGHTQKIKQKPMPKQAPLELSNLRLYNERRKLYEPQLRNKTGAEPGFLPSSSELLEEVTQQRKPLFQAPQHPAQFLLSLLLQINVQKPMTQEEIALANARYLFPEALVAQTMFELYDAPQVQGGVAAQKTIPSTCAKGRNGTFYCGRGTNKVKKTEPKNKEPKNTGPKTQSEMTQNKPPVDYGDCYRSIPISKGDDGETKGVLDPGFIEVIRLIHAMSATNRTVGEFGIYLTYDETTGRLSPNATVGTLFQRTSTMMPGYSSSKPAAIARAQIPENAAIAWHLHPWDIFGRFNTHMSMDDGDLIGLFSKTYIDGTPYGAAHAPEGLYVYSLQASVLTVIKELRSNMYDEEKYKIVEQIKVQTNELLKNIDAKLDCQDLNTRNMTHFNNIGIATVETDKGTVEIPTGFDVQFYNQTYLSSGQPIHLPLYSQWKNERALFGSKKKIPASAPFTPRELWNVLVNQIYSRAQYLKECPPDRKINPDKKNFCPSNYEGIHTLPNPFDNQGANLGKIHPFPIQSLSKVILTNLEKFKIFQKFMNEKFIKFKYQPSDTFDNNAISQQKRNIWYKNVFGTIQKEFNNRFKDVLPQLLSEPARKAFESANQAAKGGMWDYFFGVKGKYYESVTRTAAIRNKINRTQLNPENLVLLKNAGLA